MFYLYSKKKKNEIEIKQLYQVANHQLIVHSFLYACLSACLSIYHLPFNVYHLSLSIQILLYKKEFKIVIGSFLVSFIYIFSPF